MNIKFTKVVAAAVGLTMALTLVSSASAQSMTMAELVNLLISIGVIAPDKAALARSAIGSTPAVTTAGVTFNKNLTVGSTGSDVTALQQFLKISPTTAYFGPKTRDAVIAFQKENGITPAVGFFGPTTRKAVNAMVSVSAPVVDNTGTPVVTPVSGAYTVSVATDTPAPATFPAGASQVAFTKLNFTAGATDLVVTGLKVTRGGFSSDNDISNVYLMDGSSVLASNLGLANGKAMFQMTNGLFTVKAGTTKTVTVAADIVETGTATHSFSFGIASASDITANAAVAGTYPIGGYALTAGTVSNPALATLTINRLATGGTVDAGQTAFLAGQLTLQSGNSAVSVRSIKLTETGTINAASDLANIKLMNGGVQVGNTIPSLNSDGTVVFDLSNNPLQITSGNTVNLTVYADVIGGVYRNFKFTVQRAYDVVATDMTYNVGASIKTTTGGDTFNGANFPVQSSVVAINAGTLIINKNSTSPSNYIATGANNQVLAMFDVKGDGEAVRLTDIAYQLSYSAAAESAVWDNLKLVDDQGVQIGTILRSTTATTTTTTKVTVTNLNYIIPANTTRTLSIKADVKGAGSSLTAQITSGAAQGYTSLKSITFNTYAGNPLSLSSKPLAASLNNSQGPVTTVTGTPGVKVGSFSMVAGPAEGVNVVSLTVLTGANVANIFQNMKVMVGSQLIGAEQGVLANNESYTFTASPLVAIAKGGSISVDVFANVISGATATATSVVSLTGVSAQGADTSTNLNPSVSVTGQTVAVAGNGTLTTAIASTKVNTQFVAMGLSNAKVASFKLAASNNENINITRVSLLNTTNSTTGSELKNVRLMNGQTVIASIGSFGTLTTGTSSNTQTVVFDLNGTSLQVPKNGDVQLDVVADINNTDGGATSSATVTVDLTGVNGQGASSAVAANDTDTVASLATLTVYRTNIGVAATYPVGNISTAKANDLKVATIAVTADAADAAYIKTITINNTGSLVLSSSSVAVKIYSSEDENVVIGTTTLFGFATSTITLSPVLEVKKGTTVGLIVRADLNSASNLDTTAGAVRDYQIGMTGMTWNDGSTNVASLNPTVRMPISASSISFNQ